ncbi:MAG TPA: hypothetical protein VGM92_03770 [Candidatus Kapabacteria bacterium]|jgi:hypothetical protein
MMIRSTRISSFVIALALLCFSTAAFSQDDANDNAGGLPTLFSVKASAGYGLARAAQLYGYDASAPIWWSTGQGVKLNLALDLPILPIDEVDSLGSTTGTVPVIGLELEAATGYDLSTGGTTNDQLEGGPIQTTTRTSSYIPVTLGLNARTNFGGGLPSVYIGAGGGVWIVGAYQENVSFSNDASQNFSRKMSPPIPFGLYGAIGFELPLMYDPDAANSMLDLFAEVRLTEMTAYIYNYDVQNSSGATSQQNPLFDPTLLYPKDQARSASNVALSLGIKFNLY